MTPAMLSGPRRPPAPDCNMLWAASRGVCAHPQCDRRLVEFDGGRWATLGEIAHIRAHSPAGPRFDDSWTGIADSYENCILLCRDHHRLVDSNPSAYPVEMLLDWKWMHERPGAFGARLETMGYIAAPPPSARLAIIRGEPIRQLGLALATRGRVALLGMSGSGKTQLARHWFTSRAPDYTFRWWVRGHDRETLTSDLASLAALLGLPSVSGERVGTQATAVREELDERGAWLLVVDNAASPDQLSNLFPTERGHIIVTSQDQSWSGILPPFEVPPFTNEEALDLLRRSPALADARDEDLRNLIYECRGHPLVVDQAAGYIARTGIDLPSYTELLRTRTPETLERSGSPTGARFTESIGAALDRVGQDSREVLAILTQVAPGPFEIWSVPTFDDKDASDSDDSLDVPSWDQFRLEDALANLRAFSLVQREGTTLAAHDLVTDIVRSTLSKDERYVAFVRAVMALIEQLPDRPGESSEWLTMERLLPHAVAVLQRIQDLPEGFPAEATARILDRLAVYFNGRGERERAEAHFDRAIRLMQRQDLTEASMYGSLLHNRANAYADRGDYSRAEALHREALKIKERAMGEQALIVGVSCGALGSVLEARGEWMEATKYYERAARIYSHHGNHAWGANALIDLASIAAKDDHPEDAVRLLEAAIDEADRAGDAITEAVTARLRLAEIVAVGGGFARAVRLARSARLIAEAATAPIQLANALAAQGRYLIHMGLNEAGLALFERSLAIWHEVHSANPVRHATTLGNYGYGLVQAGKPDLALQPLSESQRRLEALLPADDETVSISRLLTAKARFALLQTQEAVELLRAVVRDAPTMSEVAEEATALLTAFVEGGEDFADSAHPADAEGD